MSKRPVTDAVEPDGRGTRHKDQQRAGPPEVDLFAEDRSGQPSWVPTTESSPLPSAAARSVGQLRLGVDEGGVAAPAQPVEAEPPAKQPPPALEVGNKDTPAWNTIRKLRCDDDVHDTAVECMASYIALFLRGENARRSSHVHAAAVRQIVRSSQWPAETIVEQLYLFFKTSQYDDDPRILIGEPDDDQRGPPVLFTIIEEMAVDDGTLFSLDRVAKVQPPQRAPIHSRCQLHLPLVALSCSLARPVVAGHAAH